MSQATRYSATVTSALDSPMGLNGLIDMPLLTSNSISLPQRRNLPETPLRTPTNKLASWIGVIETDRYAFETDNRGSSRTDRSSISLVAISKDHESKALGTVASRVLQMKVLEASSQTLFSHPKQLKHLSIILNRPNIDQISNVLHSPRLQDFPMKLLLTDKTR